MEYINKFLNETTVHGLYYFTSKHKVTKFIWAFLVTVSFFLCTWQSAINVRDYLSLNVVTKETYETVSEIQYPAITIWNSNFIRRTIIGRRFEFKLFMSKLNYVNFKDVKNFFNY